MKHLPPDELSVRELFEYQRKLAASHDLLERLKTLWIGALLGERLAWCSDDQIGDLLSVVQDELWAFQRRVLGLRARQAEAPTTELVETMK